MENIGLHILANKPAIKNLFNRYGIDEPVTLETVNQALYEEGEDFEGELLRILKSTAHAEGDGAKGQVALDWVNTLGGLATGITGAIVQGRNQGGGFSDPANTQPIIIQQPMGSDKKSGGGDNANTKVIIAVAITVLIGVAAFFALKK